MANNDDLYWDDASLDDELPLDLVQVEQRSDKYRRLQARRLLEQYQEDRRLRRLLHDEFLDSDDEEPMHH